MKASEPCSKNALSVERRVLIIRQLKDLGSEIAGPDTEELVELVLQIKRSFQKPMPAVHESLADIVPNDLRAEFDAEEQQCRSAIRKLIKVAKEAHQLTTPSDGLTSAEVEPFVSALMRLCELPIDGEAVDAVLSAIQRQADLEEVILEEEKPGVRPIYNQCRAAVRAAYYYRARHDLQLSVNFDYPDRTGVKAGARTGDSDLEPISPMATLACNVIKVFDIEGDAAEIQTHLRNYQAQLKREGRAPLRSDFLLDPQ